MNIIAYAYEASLHCPDCAQSRFGVLLDKPETIDREGNPISAIFDGENTDSAQFCDDCREYLYGQNRSLLIDDSAGIYIPRNFYKNFDFAEWRLKIEDFAALSSPDNDDYWEAWDDVISNAEHIDKNGVRWTLEQDGDLFAVTNYIS